MRVSNVRLAYTLVLLFCYQINYNSEVSFLILMNFMTNLDSIFYLVSQYYFDCILYCYIFCSFYLELKQ